MMSLQGDDRMNRKDAMVSFSLLSGALAGILGGSGMAQAAEQIPVFRNSLGGQLEIYSDIQKVRPVPLSSFLALHTCDTLTWHE